MPALAALTVNDGQATPVAHTFSPVRIDEKGVASFYDRSGGVAIGFPRIAISLREPVVPVKAGVTSDALKRNYKAIITIDVPKLESSTSVPTVAYVHAARIELLLPERGELQDRDDLVSYAGNLLSNATVKSIIENLEAYY